MRKRVEMKFESNAWNEKERGEGGKRKQERTRTGRNPRMKKRKEWKTDKGNRRLVESNKGKNKSNKEFRKK
jgi:hypothetical protein